MNFVITLDKKLTKNHIENLLPTKFNDALYFKWAIITVFLISAPSWILQEGSSFPQTLIEIEKSDGESYRPQIQVDENDVYLVWTDDSFGNAEILFSKSEDKGYSFSTPINLSESPRGSAFPRMAIEGNNIYVTWYDYSPGNSDIFLAKSSDRGKTFETKNLTNNIGPSYNPWIVTTDKNVIIVWNDGTRSYIEQFGEDFVTQNEGIDVIVGNQDILVATSQDRGETFEISALSNESLDSWNSRIVNQNDQIFVVWNGRTSSQQSDIFFSTSTNGGISFSKPSNLSQSNNLSIDAGMTLSNDNLYVIWIEQLDQNKSDIFFSKTLKENTTNFTKPINISNNGHATITRDTQISAHENFVFVVWTEKTSNGNPYFVKSKDNGDSFEVPVPLDLSPGMAEHSQLFSEGDKVYAIWNDDSTGNSEVFLRASFDNGTSFANPYNLSNNENDSLLFVLGPQISVLESSVYTVFENKLNKDKGNLVLSILEPFNVEDGLILTLEDNKKTNIILNYDPKVLEPSKNVEFSLMFYDSVSEELLSEVNYSFLIKDFEGNTIVNKTSQFAQLGSASHEATFLQNGPASIHIFLESLGSDHPYDFAYSGETNALITVVPEFSRVILFLGMGFFASILLVIFNKLNPSAITGYT